jgi:hypothetical protein
MQGQKIICNEYRYISYNICFFIKYNTQTWKMFYFLLDILEDFIHYCMG